MELVKKEIFDYIEDNDISEKEFALTVGCKPSLLSDAKFGKNLSFRILLKASIVMSGKAYKEKIEKWCLRLDYTEGIKHAFEYASLTKNIELLNKLLDKHKNSTGVVKQCHDLYNVIYRFLSYTICEKDLIHELEDLKGITNKSLVILQEIMYVFGMYYNKEYFTMLETLPKIEKKIKDLGERESFVKDCYLIRCSSAYAPALFQVNDIERLRFHASRLINTNICAKYVADGYYYMGMSYLVEDEERALHNLQLNYEMLKDRLKQQADNALKNLNFARSFHGKDLVPGEKDQNTVLFNKIKKGIKLSEEEIQTIMSSTDSYAFKKFYISLDQTSIEDLVETIKDFTSNKQFYFANLVMHELKRINPSLIVLDGFLNINLFKGVPVDEKENYLCFSDFSDFSRICC